MFCPRWVVFRSQLPADVNGQRSLVLPGFCSGDQTRVRHMEVTLYSTGCVEVIAEHETRDCRNVDYVHTSLLLIGEEGKELAVLPTPSRPRDQQGGEEGEDEEWRGGAMTHSNPRARMEKSAFVDPETFHKVRSVQVFTRG